MIALENGTIIEEKWEKNVKRFFRALWLVTLLRVSSSYFFGSESKMFVSAVMVAMLGGRRTNAKALNSIVAQRLYRFDSEKTSCADRSLITFVLAYMQEGNYYKLSDTIRLLTLQN